MVQASNADEVLSDVITKRDERRTFVFLTVFLFPIVTVGLIAAFGFVIWMLQLIFGPATH